MLMIVGNLQPPKHVTDMADNTIKITPKDSYWAIVLIVAGCSGLVKDGC